MESTGLDCPRCSSDIKKFDQYNGFKLSCRDCGLSAKSFFSMKILKLKSFLGSLL